MNRRDALISLGGAATAALVGESHASSRLPVRSSSPALLPEAFSGEHVKRLRFVTEAGLLPDGARGFYLMSEIDATLHERHSLWVFDRITAVATRLAASLGDVTSAALSPDGRALAVIADHRGKRQIYLIPTDGSPPRVVTSMPQGVGGEPMWSPDGRSIAFTAGPATKRDPSLPYRLDRVTYRFDGLGYLDDVVQSIHVVDVGSGKSRQLTKDRAMNGSPRWSPDGKRLLYLVSFRPDREFRFQSALHVLSVADGSSSAVVETNWGGVSGADWITDARIAFIGVHAGARALPVKADLWTVSAAGGEPECRTAGVVPGVGHSVQTDLPIDALGESRIRIVGDRAYVKGQIAGDVVIYRVALTGAESVERVGPTTDSAYFVDVDPKTGGLLYLASSFVELPDLMLDAKQITGLNRELLAGVPRPTVRQLRVTASDGLETDAWALLPARGSGPWPTVLYVHGGPYGAVGSVVAIDYHLLVAAGFAVLIHNFRGSHGYGTEFARKIEGHWGKQGSLDHHATLDAAIKAGIADPNRLGVCGLSHGGFATCWLLGTSDRFKAGVAENPVTNFASAYGEMDSGFWIAEELGGTPDQIPDVYRNRSPLSYAVRCTVPLLFVVGEADYRCNAVEAEQYHRVLRTRGVPSEIIRLPNSSHTGSWTGPVPGRIAQNETLVEWFRRYLTT